MRFLFNSLALLCAVYLPAAASAASVPSVDQLIELQRPQSTAISPDGGQVAYVVRTTNWSENAFETQIWIVAAQQGTARQLTNSVKSSSAPAWSKDGKRLAFLSDRTGKRQLYTIDPAGGEAAPLTSGEEGVSAFEWSPDGSQIAFAMRDPAAADLKQRTDALGEFDVIDAEHRMTHLYVLDVQTRKVKRLTNGAFTVGGFDWSPDAAELVFEHRIDPDVASGGSADISVVSVKDATVRALVTQAGPDNAPRWSPDGKSIAFVSTMGNVDYMMAPRFVAAIPAAGGKVENLSAGFDEIPTLIDWNPAGLFFSASQRVWSYLFKLDPATRQIARVAPKDAWIGLGFSVSEDGKSAAAVASEPTVFSEVVQLDVATGAANELTSLGSQVADWPANTREVLQWRSKDGTNIEGVLHKPADFKAGHRYPLLVVIHGGPVGTSRPVPFQSAAGQAYPVDVWVSRGFVVLEPNYRGSAAYGAKFRALNIRNLGIGDSWDVLSGVDHLIREGVADAEHVGVMGWSQGGYISAFLATHDSQRFKAISVGAGISDWMTYYVNTDIHPFTRQYLKATPWEDPKIYAATSPITYIRKAKTATLIQHGATDQRVPLPNAFELYQGLQDNGVPTKLIVYKGFEGEVGHGPTKPKSVRAVMQHNLEWFEKYLPAP